MKNRSATQALLPQWVARLVGLAALGAVGALEWQRLIGGMASGKSLLWVVVAVAAAVAVLLVGRAPVRRPARRDVDEAATRTFAGAQVMRDPDAVVHPKRPRRMPRLALGGRARALLLPLVVLLALLAGYALSSAPLDDLKPRHWDELIEGLTGGLQALGTVRLPYISADPWPRIVLELLGAELLILAGLLTFWPRASTVSDTRAPVTSPDRGYPFVALAVLIVVVASPIVSLGGTRSLVLGLTLAALSMTFLWLERVPLRPGLGVAALVVIALAGALPLAAVADRGEPWFDYRSFAESLGPDDPVRFSWSQSYGPIDWPRDGNEIMRITSGEPQYWKARDLDEFGRFGFEERRFPGAQGDPDGWQNDLPADWESRPAWTSTIAVSVRRMRTPDVIGAGTITAVRDASRSVMPGVAPGTFDSPSGLRRGDSYTAVVHVPRPAPGQLAEATTGERERIDDERVITVPFKPGKTASRVRGAFSDRRIIGDAEVHFAPWNGGGHSYASYPVLGRADNDINEVMAKTLYASTWQLSRRLKRGTENPMDYVRNVDDYLHRPEFRYTERPLQPPAGAAPLDYFLNISHEGYCQHYAGAMALLLRMGGISARVVTGFTPGGYSTRHKAWIVRDTDAHAWVEAWFDRYGWVTFDPTPSASPARSRIATLAAPSSSLPLTRDRGDDSSGDSQGQAPPISVRPDLLLGTNDDPTTTSGEVAGVRWWLWALGLVVAAALILALLLFIRRPRGKTPMDRAIAEVEDALRRVGRPVSTGTTLKQLESRLGSHSEEAAAYLRSLTSARYGRDPEPPPRSGRRAFRRALASGLGFGGSLRALWALPPRPSLSRRAPRSRTLEVETSVRG